MKVKLVSVFLLLCSTLCAQSPAEKPNFVIIFCDDLGYGDLQSFGNPTIETPHLDRMVTEGQKWTQFYSADPICTPSRAGLLTGRYPIRNGMTSAKRGVLFPDSALGLPSDEITLAEVLKTRNYATAAIGKWHLGHLPQYLPTAQGFDSYFGIPYSNDMAKIKGAPNYKAMVDLPDFYPDFNDFDVPLMENERVIEQPADQNTITRRFFLYLAHSLPHIPLFTSPNFRGQSRRGLYGDVIQEIDWSVGQVLDTLRRLKLDQNTIVVFSSDNGPWLTFRTHGGSAGPLRAGKGTTFEGGQRVPTIFWGPGRLPPGTVEGLGSTIDLLTTFAHFAGATAPSDRKMDGYDLSPALLGTAPSPRQEFFYWTQGLLHAVRTGPWKLHLIEREPVNYGRLAEIDHPELYNLERDISEAHELSELEPEIVAALKHKADLHLADTADSLPEQLSARIPDFTYRR